MMIDEELSTTGVAGSTFDQEELDDHEVIRRDDEVELKIWAWQVAKVAKIENRFARRKKMIGRGEEEHVEKATSWFKKMERKLEERRARAEEKMENEVARARRKADERRAEAEAERATKVARVLEMAKIMRALGRAPSKGTLFSLN